MARLALIDVRFRTMTKSGNFDRYGFTTDTSWSNRGNLEPSTTLSSTEATACFGDNNGDLTAIYVQKLDYVGARWKLVLETDGFAAPNNRWHTLIAWDAGQHVLRKDAEYSDNGTGKKTWTWYGGSNDPHTKEFILNFRINTSAGGYTSGFINPFSFVDDTPPERTKRLLKWDGGTDGADYLKQPDHTFPAINVKGATDTPINIIDVPCRIIGAKTYNGTQPLNGNQHQENDINIGPYFNDIENCKVFCNIGTAIAKGSDVGGNYITFRDYLYGGSTPQGSFGFNPLTDHISATNWGGKKLKDKSLFHLDLTITYGLYYSNNGDPYYKLYYTEPSSRYRWPLQWEEFYLEWPEGYELHNTRYNLNTSGSDVIYEEPSWRKYAVAGNTLATWATDDTLFKIVPKNITVASDNQYKVRCHVPMKQISGTSHNDATIQITGATGTNKTRIQSAQHGDTQDEAFSTEDDMTSGDYRRWRITNNDDETDSITSITTTADGCRIVGPDISAASADTVEQLVIPTVSGERYRATHTFTYSTGKTKSFSLRGRVADARTVTNTFGSTLTPPSINTSTNTIYDLIGFDGLRLRFKLTNLNLTETQANSARGTAVTMTNISVANGSVTYNKGELKVDTVSPFDVYWEGAIFEPTAGITGSWAVEGRITVTLGGTTRIYKGSWQGGTRPDYSAEILTATGGNRLDKNTQPYRFIKSATGTVTNNPTTSTQTQFTTPAYSGTNPLHLWRHRQQNLGNNLLSIWFNGTNIILNYSQGTNGEFTEYNHTDGWRYIRGQYVTATAEGEKYQVYRDRTDTYYTDVYTQPSPQIGLDDGNISEDDESDYAVLQHFGESKVGAEIESSGNYVKLIPSGNDTWSGPGELDLNDHYAISVIKIAGDS